MGEPVFYSWAEIAAWQLVKGRPSMITTDTKSFDAEVTAAADRIIELADIIKASRASQRDMQEVGG